MFDTVEEIKEAIEREERALARETNETEKKWIKKTIRMLKGFLRSKKEIEVKVFDGSGFSPALLVTENK